MTGMKEGAGEDPFADDPGSSGADPGDQSTDDAATGDDPDDSAGTARDSGNRQGSGDRQSMQIPYKFRRDSVQDGRDRVPLFLQTETKRAERDAVRDLEERLDDDVSLTDLREALVKAGLRNLDEVEDHLEEWGYGMTFD